MARRFRTTFVVTGAFPFPIDMLRYDRCTPDRELDSGVIQQTFERQGERGSYSVQVRHEGEDKKWEPTLGRWHSFGWKVIQLDTSVI